MIGEIDGSEFAIELARRHDEIERLAHTQKVPGLDRTEVRAELMAALWQAYRTYSPEQRTSLGQWWWVVWMNRKAHLIEAFFRLKQPHALAHDPEAMQQVMDQVVHALDPFVTLADMCPSTDVQERAVWMMLAGGLTNAEVKRALHLSNRRLKAILAAWATPSVRNLLSV